MPEKNPKSDQPSHWRVQHHDKEEQEFLKGYRKDDVELASAGRFFLEFVRGFRALSHLKQCVTVFGSARFKEGNEYYDLARKLGQRLAEEGYTVMTGGGPGIMEAANRGAKEAGGYSVGCNIELPMEQDPNPYLDTFVEFEHFFVRKVMLVKYSNAFVVMPGGFGTLDEVFEAATLIQTGKIEAFPIVAMGTDYWESLRKFVRETMITEKTISPEDLELIQKADSIDRALELIKDGLKAPKVQAPFAVE